MRNKTDRKLKILLVGPYPPPYGGIATTVFDLHHYLLDQNSWEVAVLDIGERRAIVRGNVLSTKGPWDYLRKIISFTVHGYTIHIETNGHGFKSWLSALVCAAAGLMNERKTVIAFGSGNLPAYLQQVSGWSRLVVRAVVGWAGIIICRNQDMLQAIQKFGNKELRIEIVPGFMGVKRRRLGQIPRGVEEFCKMHKPLLGATVNLSPEYGVPLVLQAVGQMREQYRNLGLVLIGIGPAAEKYLPELAPVHGHVLLTGPLAPEVTLGTMKRLSVFIRPTYFDGDSISVREALALGLPVVASDTDCRPNGVMQFQKGDVDDLVNKLRYTLEHLDELTCTVRATGSSGNADRIMLLYKELVGKNNE